MHNLHHLTGIRGLAAFIVVFYHIEAYIQPYSNKYVMAVIKHGYLAVDFFFILSGFVIAYNYFDRLTVLTVDKAYDFYIKRIARIYPLHLLLLIVYTTIPLAYIVLGKDLSTLSGGNKFSFDTFVYSLFLVQSWGGVEDLTWNIPSWSISTEMLAYLLFPLMVYLLFFMHKKLKGAGVVLSLFCTFIVIIYVFEGTRTIGDNIQRLGFLRCVLEFFCGVCVWKLSKLQWLKLSGMLMFYGAIALFCVLMASGIKDYYFVPVTMSMVILGSVVYRSRVNVFFSHQFLIWLGNISYSVYLSHYFIRDWFKLLFLNSNEASIFWIVSYVITVLIISHLLFSFFEMSAKNRVLKILLKKGNNAIQ